MNRVAQEDREDVRFEEDFSKHFEFNYFIFF